jgi:hypothetical protein
LPTVYNLHYAAYAHLAGLASPRMDILAVISTLWSVRTFLFGHDLHSRDTRHD